MTNKKKSTQLDRRTFLRSSAAAGAGLILSPMLTKSKAASKKHNEIKSDNTFASHRQQQLRFRSTHSLHILLFCRDTVGS